MTVAPEGQSAAQLDQKTSFCLAALGLETVAK